MIDENINSSGNNSGSICNSKSVDSQESTDSIKYRKILLKVSGESLQGKQGHGISHPRLYQIAEEIKSVYDLGVNVAVVVGGGNIFRGQTGVHKGFDRVEGDTIGMLATVINSLALHSVLEEIGIKAIVYSSLPMPQIANAYSPLEARRKLNKGYVVIVGGGSGNAFFTTDTAGALRALQLGVDVLLKGTRVDGVYSSDPEIDPNAVFIKTLSYDDVISKKFNVMDSTSFTLCYENNMPIIVFDFEQSGNLYKVVTGKNPGTIIE